MNTNLQRIERILRYRLQQLFELFFVKKKRVRKAGHFYLEMNAQNIIIQLKMFNFVPH